MSATEAPPAILPAGGEGVSAMPLNAVTKKRDVAMDGIEDVVFGSIAGMAGKLIEYPFDTVKVRLQSQPDHKPLRYTGPLDCFQQSFREEGFRGLYRGLSAPLIGAAIETSSLFFWEQVAQKGLFATGLYSPNERLPLSALYLTGAVSGAFTSLVLTPIELVKCKIQVATVSSSDGMVRSAPTPLAVIRQVYRHQGIMGFWNGQLGTLIRETGGCAAWFGSKETVTVLFRQFNDRSRDHTAPGQESPQSMPLPLWQQMIAGASAGASYNFLFFPADTIKSRMQTSSVESATSTMTFWKEGKALWKQYGLRGLYRGCGITVLRSAPSSAFIFVIYDFLKLNFRLS